MVEIVMSDLWYSAGKARLASECPQQFSGAAVLGRKPPARGGGACPPPAQGLHALQLEVLGRMTLQMWHHFLR